MLFVTNRVIRQSTRTRPGRNIDFDLRDPNALQSLFYCERQGEEDYIELGSRAFLERLSDSPSEHILLWIHGFASLPEESIFHRALTLQAMFDEVREDLVEVVTLVWPCVEDAVTIQNYFNDRMTADASGMAYARAFQRLREWQAGRAQDGNQCLKRISVLAHSMGARVLRESVRLWSENFLSTAPPTLFRNVFLSAADIFNESLEEEHTGGFIPIVAQTVSVYFAADDLALRASKTVNIVNGEASRRLGHTGPIHPERVLRNVIGIDCGEFNSSYDPPTGHTYFLQDSDEAPGSVFKHMTHCIETGRTVPRQDEDLQSLVLSYDSTDRLLVLK